MKETAKNSVPSQSSEINLPYPDIFEPKVYTAEDMDWTFHGEVKFRVGTQFTEEESEWIFDILDKVAYPAHEGQYRDEGPAYIIHPIEVALEAVRHGERVEVVCAALLHDTREDTDLQDENKHKLRKKFRAQSIELLTKLMSKIRFGEKISIKEYLNNLRKEPAAIRLKAYDRIVNLKSFGRMVFTEPKRVKKQIKETREEIIPLAAERHSDLAIELEELVNKVEERLKKASRYPDEVRERAMKALD